MSSQKSKCPYINNDNCGYPGKDRDDAICRSEYFQDCYSYKCLIGCYKEEEPEEKKDESTAVQ